MEPKNPLLPSKRFAIIVASVLAVIIVAFVVWHVMKKPRTVPTETPALSVGGAPQGITPIDNNTSPKADDFLSGVETVATPKEISTTPTNTSNTPAKTPTKTNAPVIDSVSPTAFGDGDTVTLRGHGFTESNTVMLSTEDLDAFTGIASPDGKTLTFKVTVSAKKALAQALAHLSASVRAQAIAQIISIKQAGSDKKDGWYVPVSIIVKNENGTSTQASAEENVTKGI